MSCGFNIAILAVILLRGSQAFVGRRYSAWVALGGVAILTLLVGAKASVVQAAIMTLANPTTIWDVGFQLSFAATLD